MKRKVEAVHESRAQIESSKMATATSSATAWYSLGMYLKPEYVVHNLDLKVTPHKNDSSTALESFPNIVAYVPLSL